MAAAGESMHAKLLMRNAEQKKDVTIVWVDARAFLAWGLRMILVNRRIYCNPIKITDPRVCSVNWEIYLG